MRALSLFSGVGGIDLACEWAGIQTAAFCEWAEFPRKVLRKHWPDVPIYEDVRTLTKERLESDGVGTIGLIHGGYPCQPFSQIGKRAGTEDERHLWPEYFRLVRELRPRWVVGENVAGHLSLGLNQVLSDLESEGYETRVFVLQALSVGAPHERERVFIVGHSGSKSESQTNSSIGPVGGERNARKNTSWVTGRSLSPSYWEVHQPPIPGVDDGPSDRLDGGMTTKEIREARSHALGNAVVPQQIYPIFAAIMQIEAMDNR